MPQIYGFQYYLPHWYVPKKRLIISGVKQPKNEVVHRVEVYPSLAKVERMMNAPVRVQQFTHLIPLDHSYRLSYLLRQFADKRKKYTIVIRQNTRENKQYSTHGRQTFFFSRKVMSLLLTDHGQTACFDRLTTRPSLAAAASSLVSPRERRLAV